MYNNIHDGLHRIERYAKTVTCCNHEAKGLNLDNILTFLGEHGADAETLRLVKSQCSDAKVNDDPEKKTDTDPQSKKQPNSTAKPTVDPKQDTGRKRSMLPKTKLSGTSTPVATA